MALGLSVSDTGVDLGLGIRGWGGTGCVGGKALECLWGCTGTGRTGAGVGWGSIVVRWGWVAPG